MNNLKTSMIQHVSICFPCVSIHYCLSILLSSGSNLSILSGSAAMTSLVDFKPSSRCSCDLCRGCNDRWYRWFEKINRSVEWNIYRKTKKCISGWWYTYPLKNMKVSWDDGIPNIWKNKIYVPNHQPDLVVCFHTDLREKKVPSTLGSMGLLNNYCIMGI